MDIDSLKKKLEQEGFKHVYEWEDEPGTMYPAHSHKGPVSMYITQGSIVLDLSLGKAILAIILWPYFYRNHLLWYTGF